MKLTALIFSLISLSNANPVLADQVAIGAGSEKTSKPTLIEGHASIETANNLTAKQDLVSMEIGGVLETCRWMNIHCKILNGCPWWATDCFDINTSVIQARKPTTRDEVINSCLDNDNDECQVVHKMVFIEAKAKEMSSDSFCNSETYGFLCKKPGCPWWIDSDECSLLIQHAEQEAAECSLEQRRNGHHGCNNVGIIYPNNYQAGCVWWAWSDC